MKRWIGCLAGCLFSCLIGSLLLTGCGRTRPDSTLVVLTPGGALGKQVREVIEGFEADHPGVRVQLITSPGKDYYIKSLTMLAGRAHVDLLWLGQGFGLFAGRGALYDLGPLIAEDKAFTLAGYQPEVLSWYHYGAHLYGIPYGVDIQAMAYNKALFAAAGLSLPGPEWNLDAMINDAGALTRRHPRTGRAEVIGLGLENLDYRTYGLTLLTPDRRHFALNNERGVQWLERNLDLIYNERILQRRGDMESADRLTGFLNQQVAMFDFATWDLPEAGARALFDWDIAPVPIGTTGERRAWASSAGFSLVARTRHPELAWELLKRLVGTEFQRRMLDRTVPTLVGLHDEFRAAHHPRNVDAFLQSLDYMDPTPRIMPLEEVTSEWNHWLDRTLLREIPPAEALKQAESHINRILSLHPLPEESAR